MDEPGRLTLRWMQGCCHEKPSFITNNKLCIPSGNFLKVIGIQENSDESYPAPGDGIGCIASDPVLQVVAIAELCLHPAIYILKYPSFEVISELKEGSEVEYLTMVFAGLDYLVALGGIPDHLIILWNWSSGKKLCTVSPRPSFYQPAAVQLSMNPSSWQELCFSHPKGITFLEIEVCGEYSNLRQDTVFLLLEGDDGKTSLSEKDLNSLRCFHNNNELKSSWSYYTDILHELPLASVSSLPHSQLLDFYDYYMKQKRLQPSCHCWLPEGDILICCKDKSIVKVNGDSHAVKLILQGVRSLESEENKDEINDFATYMALHRDGLFVGRMDGYVDLVDISNNQWNVLKTFNIGQSVLSLIFSPSYDKLVIRSLQGSLFLYFPEEQNDFNCILGGDTTSVISLGCLQPESKYCVSLRKSGLVQLWDLDDGSIISRLHIGEMAETLISSPACHYVAVGSASGYIYFLDFSDIYNIFIVHVIRPYRVPVFNLNTDNCGTFLLTGSKSEPIYVISALPTSSFSVLGNIEVEGEMAAIALFRASPSEGTIVVVSSIDKSSPLGNAANILTRFILPLDLAEDCSKYQTNVLGQLHEAALQKQAWKLENMGIDLVINPSFGAIMFCPEEYNFQSLPIWSQHSPDEVLSPKITYPSDHELSFCHLILSPSHKWMASVNADGKLCVTPTTHFEKRSTIITHSYWKQGTSSVAFSCDEEIIITGGIDGTIICSEWRGRGFSKSFTIPKWMQFCREKWKSENDHLCRLRQEEQKTTESKDLTWKEIQQCQVREEERKIFGEKQKEIQSNMDDIEMRLEQLMEENELLPEEIRLPLSSFALNQKVLKELLKAGENKVEEVRRDLQNKIHEKEALASQIKKDCWDAMTVKGRSLKAFHSFLKVNNYPLFERSGKQLETLNRTFQQREIEILEKELRRNIAGEESESTLNMPKEQSSDKENAYTGFSSSLRTLCGVTSPYLYNQFELITREQKGAQIILLQDVIYRIKVEFNKKFHNYCDLKEREIVKTKERNERIKEILAFLGLDEELWIPTWDVEEKPEQMFNVEDHEITVKKYYTPEELKELEEERKREERRRQEQEGGMQEKALQKMMGGTLEVRKEDELKKDPPPPAFLVEKPTSEWTKEEHQLARDYDKKLKDIQDEREKFRRNLKTELENLKSFIQESTETFDGYLKNLFEQKLLTDFVLYQEKLKIFILTFSVIIEDELENWERYLQNEKNSKLQMKASLQPAIALTEKAEAEAKEIYEELQAQDKAAENQAKKEFKIYPYVDALSRLYRKRPKFHRPVGRSYSANPYGSSNRTVTSDDTNALFKDLDDKVNCPEIIEEDAWIKMCDLRRKKYYTETEAKQQAIKLAEISAILQRQQKEQKSLQDELDTLINEITRVQSLQVKCQQDLPIQMIMKQGHVEVDVPHLIPDFSSVLLINKSSVDEPNTEIRKLGERKIAAMKESQHVRNGISKLQWDQKRLEMELEDLHQLLYEVQTFKVTRDMRRFLGGDKDFSPDSKVQMLAKALEMQEKFFQKQKGFLDRVHDELEMEIEEKAKENEQLAKDIESMYMEVSEMRLLQTANDRA